jgi:hypothetical protein
LSDPPLGLRAGLTAGAQFSQTGPVSWRFTLPAGGADHYRLAQLDDYSSLPRKKFMHQPPKTLSLRARASSAEIPGTWGFGLWNDPLSMGLLTNRRLPRLPAAPNTAWFFFASAESYLSLRDDLPAKGSLAATFRSPAWASALLPLGLLALPLMIIPPARRWLRRLSRRSVRQSAVSLTIDPAEWHSYMLNWKTDQATFQVDGITVLETGVIPGGRLGLVIWIDNQYLSFTPDGLLRFGLLASQEQTWIEVSELSLLSE